MINEAEPSVHLAVKAHAPNLVQFEGWVHRCWHLASGHAHLYITVDIGSIIRHGTCHGCSDIIFHDLIAFGKILIFVEFHFLLQHYASLCNVYESSGGQGGK